MPALPRLHPKGACVFVPVLVVLFALAGNAGFAQAVPAVPTQATATATLTPFQLKTLLAFAPSGAVFSNLTLKGTVDRTAGSTKEHGAVTLHSSSDGSFKETWSGAGGDREITCTSWSGGHTCTISLAGKTKQLEGLTDQRSMPWFAPWAGVPALSNLLATATETDDGNGDEVLAFVPAYGSGDSLSPSKQKQLQQMAKAASVSVLFDAATGLPSGMHYTEPLSNETSNAIDVSIVYSDYRMEQGFMIPHRIQRYIQRTLESDIHITGVSLS